MNWVEEEGSREPDIEGGSLDEEEQQVQFKNTNPNEQK